MAATVSWIDDDQTILSIRYDNPIQVEDILRALDQLTAQVETAPAPVDLIVDITAARGIPANMISSYPRLSQHPGISHPNVHRSYVVLENQALTSVIGIFDKLFAKFQIVRTVEEALRLIHEERASQSEAPEE
jgi:hypothetical protein